MKRIIMFMLLFAALKVAGQTTGYLRFDTVKIMKQNGTCELYIINKTKDSLGLLTNVGGGLTRFIKSKVLNDSTIIIGLDTLVVRGGGGTPQRFGLEDNSATGNRTFNFNGYQFTGDSTSLFKITSKTITTGSDAGLYNRFEMDDNNIYMMTRYPSGPGTRSYGFSTHPALVQQFAVGHSPGHATYVQTDTNNLILENDPNRFQLYRDSVVLFNFSGTPIHYRIRTLPSTIDTSYKSLVSGPNGQVFLRPGDAGSGGGTVQSQHSITGDGTGGSKLQLVNDAATPGINKIYGTDYAGTKGFVSPDVAPYNIVKAGADNTGVSDASTYVTAAISAGYRNIYLPDGIYSFTSTVQLKDSIVIRGAGRGRTIIKVPAGAEAFKASYSLGGNLSQLQDFTFKGTLGGAGQQGIVSDSAFGIIINNIGSDSVGGFVVDIKNNGLLADAGYTFGNQITNCFFRKGSGGIRLGVRAEYNIVSSTTAVNMTYGIYNNGGNNRIIGCNSSENSYGIYVDAGANDAHGTVVGCTFNHAGSNNVYVTGILNGMDFIGCEMFAGNITILNSDGVNFTGGTIAVTSTTCTNSPNTSFNGVRILSGFPSFTGNRPEVIQSVGGNTRVNSLDTDNTPPSTSGATKWVISDANGQLSVANTPVTSLNSQTGVVTITAGTAITTSTLSGDITVAFDRTNSAVPHTLANYLTDVNNSGTSETDLYNTTVSANKMNSNGQSIHFVGTVAENDISATTQIRVYFAGTEVANTGGIAISSTGYLKISGEIIRTTSTTARASFKVEGNGLTTDYVNEFDLTGLDFTTGNVFKVTGTAGGGGAGSNDITAKSGKLTFQSN